MAEVSILPARSTQAVRTGLAFCVWPFLLGFVPVTLLAAAQGGYFPSAWGWSALCLLWASGLALVLRSSIRLSKVERAYFLVWMALAVWIAVSLLWSRNLPQSVLEVERTLVYVSGAAAVALLGRARSVRYLLGAVLTAISVIDLFSLATRLFPGHLRVYDPTTTYRLAQPIGYWNALAVFSAMGAILALGFAARGRLFLVRAVSGALLIVLLPTFYFTFGRAGWIALTAGVVLALIIDPRRLQLMTTLLVLMPASVTAVWLAAHSPGLTRSGAIAAHAAQDGHRLALALTILAAINAALTALLGVVNRRLVLPPVARRVYAGALALSLAAALIVMFDRYGGPDTLARKGYAAFKAPAPNTLDLNRRLFSFSGNGRYDLWRLAWADARHHPWLGSGAGSYERYFLRNAPRRVGRVRDAHGLYIETLAEVGPLGLLLLGAALGMPLLAAVRARMHPLVPAAAGAYGAFLVHAIADWDWEMPAITLTALICAGTVLLAQRGHTRMLQLSVSVRVALVAVTALIAVLATIGLVGNSALKVSNAERRAGDWDRAVLDARRARTWMPWSPAPWSALGEAQLSAGAVQLARASFRKAASMDPRDWRLWYDLARASSGRERSEALRRAAALYPQSGLAPQSAGYRRGAPAP